MAAMSLPCAAPQCGKPATTRMLDDVTGQLLAHVCSEMCGLSLVGAQKRGAEEDDTARKKTAPEESPQELLAKKIRYSHALCVCFQMQALLDRTIAKNDKYEYASAIAKTLTIGSRIGAAMDAKRMLDALIARLALALQNMVAGASYETVDIGEAALAVRNLLLEEETLADFDALTGPDTYFHYVPADVRRQILLRTGIVQIMATSERIRLKRFHPNAIMFSDEGPAMRQHIAFGTGDDSQRVYYDQSLAPVADKFPDTYTNPLYVQSDIHFGTHATRIDTRSAPSTDPWIVQSNDVIRYRSKILAGSPILRTLDFKTSPGFLGACQYDKETDTTTVRTFDGRGDSIVEESFEVGVRVRAHGLDTAGNVWLMRTPAAIDVCTRDGRELGSVPLPEKNFRARIFWETHEGVWIVAYTKAESWEVTMSEGRYTLQLLIRARVAQ